MAQKQITVYIDDLTGKPLADGAAETVLFGLDGVQYELDTDARSAQRLRTVLSRYVAAGRRSSPGRTTGARRTRTADPATVRRWAAANGVHVSARGRIPAQVLSQFEAAGN